MPETRHENAEQPDGVTAPTLVGGGTRYNFSVQAEQYLASSCDDLLRHLRCVEVEHHCFQCVEVEHHCFEPWSQLAVQVVLGGTRVYQDRDGVAAGV